MDINNDRCSERKKIDLNTTTSIDFIEMFTLDANEFLKTKCVCKESNSSMQTFCKDCFSTFKEASNNCNKNISDTNEVLVNEQDPNINLNQQQVLNNKELSCVENNDNALSSNAKISCELKDLNKGLLSEEKSDAEVPFSENNEEIQMKDDVSCKCNLMMNNTDVVFKNGLNKTNLSGNLLQNNLKIEAEIKSKLVQSLPNFGDCQNKFESANFDQNDSSVTKEQLENCPCKTQPGKTLDFINNPMLKFNKFLNIENLNSNQNETSNNPFHCLVTESDLYDLINTHASENNRELFNINKSSLLNNININFMTELNDNPLNSPDLIAIETNLSENLDPKNASHPTSVLQDLLNPPSTDPNSSETAPSRHQQESAHGESCASHTSIETYGRWREQAPRCSREFAADAGANDALRRRISQDNTTANNLLNEIKSDNANCNLKPAEGVTENVTSQFSCNDDGVDTRVAKERRQHLSWGFRNGRLVFAESKSDLGGSRLQLEQVVGSVEDPLKAANIKSGNFLTENLKEASGDCCAKETTDKQQVNATLSPVTVDVTKNKFLQTEYSDDICTGNQTPPKIVQNKDTESKFTQSLNSNNLHSRNHNEYDYQNPKIEQVAVSNLESIDCSTDGKHLDSLNKDTCQDILYSKDINRRLEDSNSRIKYLEDKLKKAGLIDQNFEVSEVCTPKVHCADVNNLVLKKDHSSQNTCICDKVNTVPDLINNIELDSNKNKCKSIDVKVDEGKKDLCLCVNGTVVNDKTVLDTFKINVTCNCGSSKETVELKEKSDNTDNEPLTVTSTTYDKHHHYKVAHSFNPENLTVDKENEDLNVEKVLTPKYIEYSVFQKSDSDSEKTSLDTNQNIVKQENYAEGEDLIPEDSHGLCEFDVNNFSGFSAFDANELSGRYDEFLEDSSSDESCDCDEDEHFIVIRRMRGDGCTMVNEPDRTKHNPDRTNLKSLLKKPGRSKDKKSNRVVFNENKNEFFDADYIILIREECDYDEDDDDGVCTCNQHEMVRLTCCEPNCNCQGYEGFEQTPQSPKFAPPIEFVDAVTLSPPEGYKDMELMASRGQQRGAVCRECSATHEEEVEEEGEGSQSDSEMDAQTKEQEEKEKTDQSQQTTPTTPPSSESPNNQNYILETITMTTVTQQQILRDTNDPKRPLPASQGSPISGILKGGRLWKQQSQQSVDSSMPKSGEPNLVSSDSVTSDDETGNKRSVRFIESEERETRDSCDGAAESSPEEEASTQHLQKTPIIESQIVSNSKQETYIGNSSSPDATEMTLTFKLGNHVLISNNSLKPNSAVRQLFPCTKTLATPQGVGEEENSQQYLVTAESLRAFEEAKRSKLPQIIQSGETDETIKRAIERNTLRRSLIRYEPRSKKQPYKTDNSLVERIKQLTCDVDYNVNSEQNQQQSSLDSSDPSEDVLDNRSSPPGEESRQSPDVNNLGPNKSQDKSFSPSSSSSSSSMSLNQNYLQLRKLSGSGEQALMMDLKRIDNMPDIQNNFRREAKPLPDIGGPHNHDPADPPRAVANQPPDLNHCAISNKMSSSSTTSESRRQFLAPLTACVTMGVAHNEDYYYHLSNNSHNQPGERISVASSGTEYSLDDIDEVLKTEDEEHKRIAPDVLVGTPSASESGDELAMFVQQDAGRIERIKKKYQAAEQQPKDNKNNDEDDEHDDYGFNRRPSVRGIKPRFSTTTEILQQIQNQLQPPVPPPSRVAWPYYSESGLTDNSKQKNANQNVPANYQYANVSEEAKTRGYPTQYRPTSLQDENLYQNCANQRCLSGEIYHRPNMNTYSPVVRMGNEYYQSLPVNRPRNGRPQSPPPMDMSKQYHQTMVYIPYNHIEGYQPIQYYHHTGSSDYVSRVSSQNQINKRYVEPLYQSRVHHHVEDHHYSPNMIPPVPPKTLSRVPYPNGQPPPHMMGSRSESPLPGQFSTARATQTPAPAMATCGYYPSNPRYRPMIGPVWQGEGNYATKVNRHSFPLAGPRYPPADSISLTDSDSQHSGSLPNGYRQSDISCYVSKDSMPNSPTKPRFIERGVPEGAASVSPQDISGVSQSSSSTMTSPTSPQNPPVPSNQKPLFYAMNV